VLDGVSRCGADSAPCSIETSEPTDDRLNALLQTIIARLMKMLSRQGVLVADMGRICLAAPDQVPRRAGAEREAATSGGAAGAARTSESGY
jgi:hypothetical protein